MQKNKTRKKKSRSTKKRAIVKPFKVNIQKKKIAPHKINHPDNITQWMAILVILVSNLLISVILIPLLIILEKVPLYGIIILLAVMFGTLFELILESMGDLEHKHHIIAHYFIPALAIINITIITTLTNKITTLLLLPVTHTPAILSLIYAIAFLSPFIYKYTFNK